ncbi:carboxypeptidase-like regulatory domain-containing protein [Hufsiella arboris]|nr:carboxypeptidase-like regulatory domain-containing protein [Hufsiella arboris]
MEKTAKLVNERPLEKVYVHFDKPYYATGDTIWFKAYVTMDQHVPSTLSKVVNVEFINSNDSLMASLKLPVNNSVAYGSVVLAPLQYKQGNYHVRAYTQWMMNHEADYFFNKTVTIGNAMEKDINTSISYHGNINDKASKPGAKIQFTDPSGQPIINGKVDWNVYIDYQNNFKGKGQTDDKGFIDIPFTGKRLEGIPEGTLTTTIETKDKKTLNSKFVLKRAFGKYDVQFFPEGGDLISEVPKQVAFKAIGGDGKGVTVKGNVVDNAGNNVADFSSQHLGMGKFILNPQPGKTYRANVTFNDGSSASYDLPKAKVSGISLSIDNKEGESLQLKIFANTAFYQLNQNKSFYIIGQQQGFITYAAQTKLQQQVYSAAVPKAKFKSGIAQFTLFSAAGVPLTERIVFISQPDQLAISLKSDKPTYLTRQKVKLSVLAQKQAAPAQGNFSVAVIDESKVPYNEDSETTILSHLLLTSDLKGYIEDPNYYFHKPDTKKIADLDVLMLTQGYRRFSYSDVIADKLPPIYFLPEQGIELSGILRQFNGMPVFKAGIRLTVPDKHFSAEARTDADGNFKFENLSFADSSEVTISARNNVNSKAMRLTMNGQSFPEIAPNMNYPDEVLNIDTALDTYLKNSSKQYAFTRMLKEVQVTAKQAVKKPSHMDYGALTGLSPQADHIVNGEQFAGCNVFIQCLQTAALGLTYNDNNFYITRAYNNGNKTPVQIYMGGLAVDINALSSVVPSEVESVEIFLNDGLSGINRMSNTNGVLVVNMKAKPKGKKMSADEWKKLFPDQNAVTFQPQGYTLAKQFYVPKYSGPKTSLQANDYRSTVYWNPQVITDQTGAASVEFYSSDGKGTYKAVIEGIDKDGNIGRSVYRFNVK